jgi:hypothetical protein
MKLNTSSCKIFKYADDTAVLGLINADNERDYISTVEYVANWCNDCYLNLNVSKTKEVVFDFWKNKCADSEVMINDCMVEKVDKYKYLGVYIQNNVTWHEHLAVQFKKAASRFYHIRCLRNLKIQDDLICLVYNALVSSVLMYAVSCWYNSCGEHNRKKLNSWRKRLCKMVKPDLHVKIENPCDIYENTCIKLAKRILQESDHPLCIYYNLLPHGVRYRSLRCRTSRYRDSFVPCSVRLLNSTSAS